MFGVPILTLNFARLYIICLLTSAEQKADILLWIKVWILFFLVEPISMCGNWYHPGTSPPTVHQGGIDALSLRRQKHVCELMHNADRNTHNTSLYAPIMYTHIQCTWANTFIYTHIHTICTHTAIWVKQQSIESKSGPSHRSHRFTAAPACWYIYRYENKRAVIDNNSRYTPTCGDGFLWVTDPPPMFLPNTTAIYTCTALVPSALATGRKHPSTL